MQFEEALKVIKENTAKAMRLPKWSPEVKVFAVPSLISASFAVAQPASVTRTQRKMPVVILTVIKILDWSV